MPTEANHQPDHFDAVVVGGSYAGLSAALQLARARRKVLVIDAGQRRNRYAASSHGFLGQDGKAPGSIVAQARDQLMAYPTVHWREGTAASASHDANGFAIRTEAGDTVTAGRLVLATGVVDELPDVQGLAERWGRSVFHCPYCHGFELEQGRIGVLASSELSMHHALMLPHWGQVTLFLNGAFEPTVEQYAELAARNVAIEAAPVRRIADRATVELDDGRRVEMDGLFTVTRTRVASPLAEQLGCVFEAGPLGAFIRTDAGKETSVPGVFACGDAARATGNVAIAVGDGALAGAGAHRSMLFGRV
jgi:thioredoxin reductase